MKRIYMNNAATSHPKPDSVCDEVYRVMRELGGNPGRGSNQPSMNAGRILLEAREALASLFSISDSSRIAFTLNVTQALNIGLKGLLKSGDHVVTSSMEHNAVARPLSALTKRGVEWTTVPCAPDGSLDPHEVRKAVRINTRLICVLHASNVTGTIMPIEEIGKIAREYGLVFMVDSAQTAGVLPINVKAQNIDILAFTGHKGLLGPQGTGGIYIRLGLDIEPLIEGGTGSLSETLKQPDFMPDRFESGTPNVPGVAGLLAGLKFITEKGLEQICQHERKLTDMLIGGLKEIPKVRLYGPGDSGQQTAVVSFNLEDMDCNEVCQRLESEYGVISRSGLHCAPLAHQSMGTLKIGSCRLSPGIFTSEDEIISVVEAIYNIVRG